MQAGWREARSVVARLAVVEGEDRSRVRLIAVWNGSSHSITRVRVWVMDSAGNRVTLIDERRNRVDHLFRALILPAEEVRRDEVRSAELPAGDLDSADLVVDWVLTAPSGSTNDDKRWRFTDRKAAEKKINALTGATADQLRIAE